MAGAVKLLGAALVTLASLLGGGEAARRLKRRSEALEELAFGLGLLGFELESFRRPLPELCRHLSGQAPGAAGQLFERLCQGLEQQPGESFSGLWQKALGPLKGPERALLLPLGAVLGRYGAPEQRRALSLCQTRLEELAAEARERHRRNGRLYLGLGAALGAGISLMML